MSSPRRLDSLSATLRKPLPGVADLRERLANFRYSLFRLKPSRSTADTHSVLVRAPFPRRVGWAKKTSTVVARANAAWAAISLPWSQVRVLTSCAGIPVTVLISAFAVVVVASRRPAGRATGTGVAAGALDQGGHRRAGTPVHLRLRPISRREGRVTQWHHRALRVAIHPVDGLRAIPADCSSVV